MKSRQEKKSAVRYSVPRDVQLIIKETRIKICKECLKGTVHKNRKAESSPPPENWTAELWLCFHLRRDDKCPQGLPPISCQR